MLTKEKLITRTATLKHFSPPSDHAEYPLTSGGGKNADGKGSGQYDFTSLLGSDKKKLLATLPQKLVTCTHEDTCQTVIQIWEDFHELYTIVTDKNPCPDTIDLYFTKAKNWINLFTSLRDVRLGYKRAAVTPYMHSLVYHIPIFLKNFKSVKLFTGQGVEKNNDVARNVVLHKSNKRNAAADVLKLEFRQWELRDHERTKRSYSKKNMTYWDTEIKEKRRKGDD